MYSKTNKVKDFKLVGSNKEVKVLNTQTYTEKPKVQVKTNIGKDVSK